MDEMTAWLRKMEMEMEMERMAEWLADGKDSRIARELIEEVMND